MIEGVPVDVGLVHEGERIRKQEMQLELGGPGVGADLQDLVQRLLGEALHEAIPVRSTRSRARSESATVANARAAGTSGRSRRSGRRARIARHISSS